METMARKLSALGKGAPDVESKLDEFISRANNDLLDVSAFDPNNREHQLQREVDELKDKLAIAEARARGSTGWGKAAIAFVVGCGVMFAVTTLMPRDQAAKEEPKAAVAPAPVAAPAAQVTPIEPPAQQAAAAAPAPAPEPAAAPAPAPEPAHETIAAAPTPPPASTPKPTKHARHASTTSSPSTTKPAEPTPAAHEDKPAENKQAGSDTLYNPF